jgi:hypothetical protein
MKKFYLVILLFFSIDKVSGQQWDFAFHSEHENLLTADSAGNFFTVKNNLIKRYTVSGSLSWQLSYSGNLWIRSIAADNSGSLYIIGIFDTAIISTININSGNNHEDVLIAKFDSSANLAWYHLESTGGIDYAGEIYVNRQQHVFACGWHYGDSTSITGFYINKYDLNGNLISQISRAGGSAWEIGTDANENIIVLGGVEDTTDLGNNYIYYPQYMGSHFVVKFNSSGNTEWARDLGTNYYGASQNLGVASNGDLYLSDWCRYCGFSVTKYDNATGNTIWLRGFGGVYGDCEDLLVDKNDHIWFTGGLWSGGPPNYRPYLWKYKEDGTLMDEILETHETYGWKIAADGNNNIFVTGQFGDSAWFGNIHLDSLGGHNFIAKLNGDAVTSDFNYQLPTCQDQPVVFTNNSFGETNYYWQLPGGNPASANTSSASVLYNTPGIYSVMLISSNNSQSDTAVQTITVFPKPTAPIISQSSNTLSSNYNQGSFQWIYMTDTIPLAIQPYYNITYEGDYQLIYTDTNGCYNTSQSYSATFDNVSFVNPAVTTSWVKTFGGPEEDFGNKIIQTLDGGFLICGVSKNFTGRWETALLKFDPFGTLQWTKVVFNGWSQDNDIIQTSDSGYYLLNNVMDTLVSVDPICLNKLDKFGNVLWSTIYRGGVNVTSGYSLTATSDGGCIITGNHNISNPWSVRAYLIKISNSGSATWAKTVSRPSTALWGNSTIQIADSGFIMAGISKNVCDFICRVNPSGSVVWYKELDSLALIGNYNYTRIPPKLIKANDDGYILAGGTAYNSQYPERCDAHVTKVDTAGNIIWSKLYGTAYEDRALSIIRTGDGYVVLGMTEGFLSKQDLLLFKIDNNGNLLWSRSYGSKENDKGTSLCITPDGGYAITGTSNNDIYFIKTDSLGNTGCNSMIVWPEVNVLSPAVLTPSKSYSNSLFPQSLTLQSEFKQLIEQIECYWNVPVLLNDNVTENNTIHLFPNPTTGLFTLHCPPSISNGSTGSPTSQLNIYNSIGKLVYNKKLLVGRNEIDLSAEPKGVYFLEVNNVNKKEFRKIVLN